jgi:hypothetical protein
MPFLSNNTQSNRKALILAKERKLKQLETKYYEINDIISSKVKALQDEKDMGKSNRVSRVRLETHHKNMTLDARHRSSDREFSIRTYSNMDKNIWEYPDMRSWFNSLAPEGNPMEYKLRPVDTGYTIRVDPSYRELSGYEKNELKLQKLSELKRTSI